MLPLLVTDAPVSYAAQLMFMIVRMAQHPPRTYTRLRALHGVYALGANGIWTQRAH